MRDGKGGDELNLIVWVSGFQVMRGKHFARQGGGAEAENNNSSGCWPCHLWDLKSDISNSVIPAFRWEFRVSNG
jgi:hypothetical protein